MKELSKIGIFSGTFDPFHTAHLEICNQAKAELKLDEILLMLEKSPKHKSKASSVKDRIKIIEYSISDLPYIRYKEMKCKNITFKNVKPILKEQYPNSEYWFLLGSDVLRGIENWQYLKEFFSEMKLCIFLRHNMSITDVEKILNRLKLKYGVINFLILPPINQDISSSKVRIQIKSTGQSKFINHNANKHIIQNKMYQEI